MPDTDLLIHALTTILVTIDPPGLAPIFLSLTAGMSRIERRQVATRGSLIAFCILAVFAMFGDGILGLLGISIGAFRIAGGLLLFWIAFEMIFEKRNERKEKTSETATLRDHIENIAVFPLALPLIAGPGAISATILLAGSYPGTVGRLQLILVIGVCIAILFAALFIADRIDRFLGQTGRAILTRLLGVILAALAVQFVVDGITSAFALKL
jgi:multiple antibiotic resistance protein